MLGLSLSRIGACAGAVLLAFVPGVTRAGWSSGEGLWYRYPLPGAEVKSLVADRATRGGFYVGTAQGGFYRSTDEGRTWATGAGGAAFPGYAVTSIVADPLQAGEVWVGLTGVVKGGALARSDNYGATWTEVRSWPDRAAARVVAVAGKGERRVVAVGGDYGVELTEDGGLSWRPSAPPLDPGSGISFLTFHPTDQRVLFCGSYRHPFVSRDLGRTWRRIAAGMVEDTEVFTLDFAPGDPTDIWASTCGWVYRTTDGGGSWTRFREGLTDRRSHVVRRDPLDPKRLLVGTTGGLFESADAGKSFHRISREMVVNAIAFDPARPQVVLVGTEAEGVFASEDGGRTLRESNHGLAEARLSAIAETASGRIIVARAADGLSGGLWTLDPKGGETVRLAAAPPATVLALQAVGERLVAATPEGIFVADGPGLPFSLVLPQAARSLASDGPERLVAATDAGVFDSRDQGRSWSRMGSVTGRVEWVRRARFTGLGLVTWAAEHRGRVLWWDRKDWVFEAVRVGEGKKLTGGFGRPTASPRWTPEPIGLEVDPGRALLLYRPEDEAADGVALALPEQGLVVAGWAGDPRAPAGLFLATMGRGLFRFVPKISPDLAAASSRPGQAGSLP